MVFFGMKYTSGGKRLIQGGGVRKMRGSACFEAHLRQVSFKT